MILSDHGFQIANEMLDIIMKYLLGELFGEREISVGSALALSNMSVSLALQPQMDKIFNQQKESLLKAEKDSSDK